MIEKTIDTFLEKTLPSLKIAVLGDVMVDRYVMGDVSRISPEAPVPIIKAEEIKSTLGGAANVASNLSNLDCQVFLSGIIGEDSHSKVLYELLETEHIDASGLIVNQERPTTSKFRVLGRRQQMLRIDFEETGALTAGEEMKVLQWLEDLIAAGINGIVISDYGKGFFSDSLTQRIIEIATHNKILTIVDPKGSDWSKYKGADYITPNVKELSECAGYSFANTDEEVVKAARRVKDLFGVKHIVATRSEQGISLVGGGGVWHSAATQQDVYDVSGAGDTVVAMILTCMAGGLSNRAALHISNGAAGIVVSKVGTYPIHRKELIALWDELRQTRKKNGQIISSHDMAEQIRQWQGLGESVVFTNGCFDILHRGHVTYLQKAAQLGDHFIIGLNSDESVRRLKGITRPLVAEQDRAFVLEGLSCVDGVVVFSEDTPYELLHQLRPNILAKGGDYKAEDVIGKEWVDKVVIIPFEEGFSTSSIVAKIATMVREGKL